MTIRVITNFLAAWRHLVANRVWLRQIIFTLRTRRPNLWTSFQTACLLLNKTLWSMNINLRILWICQWLTKSYHSCNRKRLKVTSRKEGTLSHQKRRRIFSIIQRCKVSMKVVIHLGLKLRSPTWRKTICKWEKLLMMARSLRNIIASFVTLL